MALRNLGTFEFAAEDEAIVDALGAYICLPIQFKRIDEDMQHIHTSRGHLPLLIQSQWFPKTSKSGMSKEVAPRLSFSSGARLCIQASCMDKKIIGYTIFNDQEKQLHDKIIIDRHATLSVLTFSAGTLNVELPDCIKRPGIYGTIFQPNELLDTLIVENGENKNSVRFAGQFKYSQSEIDGYIQKGYRIILSENLTIIIA